ncbi:MAG: PorT family protein [Bacteroidales bacterium]|nr:PorT family protein [Bacteroidales bacterium]
MKRKIIIGLIGLVWLAGPVGKVRAQFGDYGVRLGLGLATMNDDLSSSTPVIGASLGGYLNYTFAQSQSVLEETFFLQVGLNLTRRGSNFEEVLENGASLMLREGYYHSYYVQLPVLACVHYELPIRARGHVVGLFVGPSVSYGLFGRYNDRRITPGIASTSANYDLSFNGSPDSRKVFNHLNQLDVSAIIGLSYEYKRLNASFYIDHGFLATSEGDDILRIIENAQSSSNVNVKIPNGHNVAYMLSISYALGSFMKE